MRHLHRQVLARVAAASLLVLFTAAAAPAIQSDVAVPGGLLCTDQMETEPYSDDLEPTAIADTIDDAAACDIDTTPVAI